MAIKKRGLDGDAASGRVLVRVMEPDADFEDSPVVGRLDVVGVRGDRQGYVTGTFAGDVPARMRTTAYPVMAVTPCVAHAAGPGSPHLASVATDC
jgi:hypothetical protein